MCSVSDWCVWLLEADTAAWLLAKLRAEYQCSTTVTAGNICPFEMDGERKRERETETVNKMGAENTERGKEGRNRNKRKSC